MDAENMRQLQSTLEESAHQMRLLFGDGYGNAAGYLVQQFGEGGIAERLVAALEKQADGLAAENEKLRTALMAVCNSATNGHCAGAVSTEFLLAVPLEAAACRQKLMAERDALKAKSERLSEAMEALQKWCATWSSDESRWCYEQRQVWRLVATEIGSLRKLEANQAADRQGGA